MILPSFALLFSSFIFGAMSSIRKSKQMDYILYIIMWGVLVLFCATKYIGADQDSVAYVRYASLDDATLADTVEPSFIWIANLARAISYENAMTLIFLAYALTGVSLKLYAIRICSSFPWMSLSLYISFYFLLHEFTQIRTGVAAGFLIISVNMCVKRRPILFLCTVFTATFFHYSAIVFLPIYLLSTSHTNWKRQFFLAISIPLAFIIYYIKFDFFFSLPIDLMQSKLDNYTEAESLRNVKLNPLNLVYICRYIFLYMMIFSHKKIENCNKYYNIMIQIYAISMFSYVSLAFNSTFAMRISELLGVFEIILLPMIYYLTNNKFIFYVGIVIICLGSLSFSIFEMQLIQSV